MVLLFLKTCLYIYIILETKFS